MYDCVLPYNVDDSSVEDKKIPSPITSPTFMDDSSVEDESMPAAPTTSPSQEESLFACPEELLTVNQGELVTIAEEENSTILCPQEIPILEQESAIVYQDSNTFKPEDVLTSKNKQKTFLCI